MLCKRAVLMRADAQASSSVCGGGHALGDAQQHAGTQALLRHPCSTPSSTPTASPLPTAAAARVARHVARERVKNVPTISSSGETDDGFQNKEAEKVGGNGERYRHGVELASETDEKDGAAGEVGRGSGVFVLSSSFSDLVSWPLHFSPACLYIDM
jgi:hypothetical protein